MGAGHATSGQPELGLRERQKRDRRRRISRAATEMFTERGYHQVTTQEVAAAADVGTGTLFRYAPTKGELLLMVVVDQFQGIDPADHDTGNTVEDVLALFSGMVGAIRRRPDNAMVFYQELFFGAPGPNRDNALELVADLHTAIETVLCRHPATGSGVGVADLARTVANACFMEVLRAGMQPEELTDLDAALRRAIRTVVTGHLGDLEGVGA